MIDLIIPHYNNRKGLMHTLASIDTDIFEILIIDDGSDEDEIPILPAKPHREVIYFSDNHGPGYVRQYGLMHTSSPYVMFLDCGDTFTSDMAQYAIQDMINKNENVNMFSFVYNHYGEPVNPATDNRMHGKVYKREFLEKYDISFCRDSSYMDEDIGFNRTCRLILNQSPPEEIMFINVTVIDQNLDENSLTQKDNRAAVYRDQTRALSTVSIHTIETCRRNNFSVQEEINEIAISLYYWFIRTAAERPEFINEAWQGAKIFFDYFIKEIDAYNLAIGSTKLKMCLSYRKELPFPINIVRFVRDIHLYKIVPTWYIKE